MPSDSPAAVPVLTAAQRAELVLGGRRYTVRALTYGEHCELQVRAAARQVPSQAVINDALRQAAEAAGRADLAEAVTAAEEAEDALAVFECARPPALDAEGFARWEAEHAAERNRLLAASLRAGRGHAVAANLFGASPQVEALRRRAADAARAAAHDLIAVALIEVDGHPATLTPGQVDSLPAGHVAALAAAIGRLLAPGPDARKN